MRSRVCAGLVLALAAVAAVATLPAAAAATTATKSSSGCGRTVAAGVSTQHLTIAGFDRQYLLSVPVSYRKDTPAPLVLDFHGLGSSMQQQSTYSRLAEKGGAEGYIVITPDGSGDVIKRWVPPPLPGSDVEFVKAILSTSRRTLCIDARRVYATGISNGAIFSTALACALPGRLAAIAPVAGVNGTKVCSAGTPPTAVLAFHGTADPIVPYAVGAYFSGDASASAALRAIANRIGGLQAQPVDDAVAKWAAFDGCGTPATTTAVATDVEHVVYPDCPPSGAVALYRILGGGHTWPGGIAVSAERLGPTTSSIDATALMLAFFDAHPRKG
jgi:polyhydroxybutyrate depolymerase